MLSDFLIFLEGEEGRKSEGEKHWRERYMGALYSLYVEIIPK